MVEMKMYEQRKVLALGDEAVSFAAIDAGVKGVFGYPGTPSSEVFEAAEIMINELKDGRIAEWAANEKTAYEIALGCSYTGNRTLVTMKHVGLNVAMDPFVNSALTGVRGGFVLLVADDPSMHSSQNEQDSRYLADFAHIPCLEPSTVQEAYDLTLEAFELSEKLKLPVMLRLVTRIAHSRSTVNRGEMKMPISLGIPTKEETFNWVLVPRISRIRYNQLRENLPILQKSVEKHNKLKLGRARIGIAVSGMGKAHYDQLCRENEIVRDFTRLNVQAYPLGYKIIEEMLSCCDVIYVFEEDYPYIEDQFISASRHTKIHGRRDRTIPISGELTPLEIRKALNLEMPEIQKAVEMKLPPRPPRLCEGCGHIDAYKAIKEAFLRNGQSDFRVFGDIGCYTLGVQKPYECLHATVEMGASVGMTFGAAVAGMEPAIGVIGDSTFCHSGITGLISIAKSKVNANLVIMDNKTTAMTGQQPTIMVNSLPDIAKGVGFEQENIHELIPLPKYHEENVEKLVKILNHPGPDVIIFKRDCVQAKRKGFV
jgi:indolepyruvate ferredoxin oxidoreductase, alpha subunit